MVGVLECRFADFPEFPSFLIWELACGTERVRPSRLGDIRILASLQVRAGRVEALIGLLLILLGPVAVYCMYQQLGRAEMRSQFTSMRRPYPDINCSLDRSVLCGNIIGFGTSNKKKGSFASERAFLCRRCLLESNPLLW